MQNLKVDPEIGEVVLCACNFYVMRLRDAVLVGGVAEIVLFHEKQTNTPLPRDRIPINGSHRRQRNAYTYL